MGYMATVTSCENALLIRKQREQRENAAASGFPHFSGQSETRLKVSEEESGHFCFSLVQDFILATLVKFLLCFGLGKVSL